MGFHNQKFKQCNKQKGQHGLEMTVYSPEQLQNAYLIERFVAQLLT